MRNYKIIDEPAVGFQTNIRAHPLKAQAQTMKSWVMAAWQVCDLEMLLTGAFSPLENFMGESDYHSVIENMHLTNGQFWPVPIVLDVSKTFAAALDLGETIALRDVEGILLATLLVQERWLPDKNREAHIIYGTEGASSQGVGTLPHLGGVYLAGRLQAVELPPHHDYLHYRQTPDQLRARFCAAGWLQVIAVQPQHAVHRVYWDVACRYGQEHNAGLLVQYPAGLVPPEDTKLFMRIRCQEYIFRQYPAQATQLNLLNFTVRTAGTRELLLSALIQRNYGCTHFMVSLGQGDALRKYEAKLGLRLLLAPAVTGQKTQLLALSDAELSYHLHAGLPLPDNFSFPEVLAEIQKAYPPRKRQGFAVFFTGLSGSGKSTMANALLVKMMEIGGRAITLLDGDVVRKHLSSELNFSKEHRDINIRRIGFVASEIVKNGGIAICAPIAPYANIRQEVRDMVGSKGGFIEVHVATPLAECEKRDRKGLYAKARAGILKGFTGIDDPYEIPENPELRVDTCCLTPAGCTELVLQKLEQLGYIER